MCVLSLRWFHMRGNVYENCLVNVWKRLVILKGKKPRLVQNSCWMGFCKMTPNFFLLKLFSPPSYQGTTEWLSGSVNDFLEFREKNSMKPPPNPASRLWPLCPASSRQASSVTSPILFMSDAIHRVSYKPCLLFPWPLVVRP